MLQLPLMIISVIVLLVPSDECLHISDSAESELLKELTNVQPSESKLLPFLYKQQSSQSLDGPLTSSPIYQSAPPNLSGLSKSSYQFLSKGQESALHLKESNLKKLLNSNLISEQKAPSSKSQLSDLSVPINTPFEYQNTGKIVALSNTAPFLKGKSETPSYKSASPSLSEPPKSSFFSKGQESSLYLKEFNLKSEQKSPSSKPQLSDLAVPLDSPFEYQNAGKVVALSNTAPFSKAKSATLGPRILWPSFESTSPNLSKPPKSSFFSKGQESPLYLQKSDSKKPPSLSSVNSKDISEVEVLSSKPPLSDLIVPLDTSFEYQKGGALSNMVPLCILTLCELKKQVLKGIQSSTDDLEDQKFLVRVLSTNYKNPDQRLPSRTRAKKIKIKKKSDEPSQLAQDWYGSKKSEESLAKKKKPTSKKLKIFSTLKQEMKYKQTLKQNVEKGKKAKKIKIHAQGIEPLKNSLRNREDILVSSRKSKTLRCYNTRKQDDNGSHTVCVTYPKSWGAAVPYPYYYPLYYPAFYYYPYYYYGRR